MSDSNLRMRLLTCWLACAAFIALSCCPVHAQTVDAKSVSTTNQVRTPKSKTSAANLIQEAFSLYRGDQNDQAAAKFREAITLSKAQNDTADEAEAHRGLGLVLMSGSHYDGAQREMTQALTEFQSVRNLLGAARAQQNLGTVARLEGDWKTARQLYRQSLAAYQSQKSIRDEASVIGDMEHDSSLSVPERERLIQQALALARQAGDKDEEGKDLHDWGDKLFAEGDYAGAIEKLEEAAVCLQQANDRWALGRLFTSEGRIYRAHGLPEKAIEFYQRGLKIQIEIGDLIGAVQDINATAIAHNIMGQQERALTEYESALEVARKTGSPEVVNFILGNLAGQHLQMGHYAAAASMFEELIPAEKNPYLLAGRYIGLSDAEFETGNYSAALDAANRAWELRANIDQEMTVNLLFWRASAEEKLGRISDSVADVNTSLGTLDEIRSHLAPDDPMKRNFMDRRHWVFDLAIALYHEQGNDSKGLEFAERFRSRALEDLLASRAAKPTPAESQIISSAAKLEGSGEVNPSGVASQKTYSTVRLALRGGEASTAPGTVAPRERLASFASAQPLDESQIASLATQIKTTILSYWVAHDATYIWIVQPGGGLQSARVDISSERLSEIVHSLWPADALEGTTNEKQSSSAHSENGSKAFPSSIMGRGGERLEFSTSDKKNWRALYICLIQPIEKYLPHSGASITVEANGPLLMVPFAALIDKRGRYLVERYAFSYTPSLSLLSLEQDRQDPKSARFVLIADPTGLPKGPHGAFPALPGARLEVSAVERFLPPGQSTTLIGRQAQELAVESQAESAQVIHFATHGVLDNRQPDESYLALGTGGSSLPDAGRLTADKIYGLRLNSDLVFLSSCRTGMGQISSDGIIGLTRAFFYAGASSVIASLWDVSDETTVRLVPEFYRAWLKDHDKSQALRQAQLHLLRDLRAGRVRIRTANGTFALPEDPVLWASFILEGQPH